ncbi:MAG: lasso RiPP family leader peptide-containing protein [Pseudomonadota bacterium]
MNMTDKEKTQPAKIKEQKRKYLPPELIVHGSVEELTRKDGEDIQDMPDFGIQS